MVGLRRTFTMLVLGSAVISRAVAAQHGSSVSLTHTVTVTVPPRVKVQLAPVVPSVERTARAASGQFTEGLALSINATQSWTLSIGSAGRKSQHQWSVDRDSEFAPLTRSDATVTSGVLSSMPATATVFFRRSAVGESVRQDNGSGDSDAVVLTVVAP
jgi:hypothetical protein